MSERYILEQIEFVVTLMCYWGVSLVDTCLKKLISFCFVEFGSYCSHLPYQWCLEKKSELLY